MRTFSLSESSKTILFLYPFYLENLHSLFPIASICSIKGLIAFNGSKVFSLNKRVNSSELESLQTRVNLLQLKKIIKHLGIQPYEYELKIEGINFKNFLGKSVLISTDRNRMNQLLKKLHLPENILSLSDQTLLDIDENANVETIGKFDSVQKLFNYLYDEIYEFKYMNSDCPF